MVLKHYRVLFLKRALVLSVLLLLVATPGPAGAQTTPCAGSDTTMCLDEARFQVEVEWRDFQNRTGSGSVVPSGSSNSGLFYFFSDDNWEVLVKLLDGCELTGDYWVFAAVTSNVEYTLTVTDTLTGSTATYFNPLGHEANAITDTKALGICNPGGPPTHRQIRLDEISSGNKPVQTTSTTTPSLCVPAQNRLCLTRGRFQTEVEWRDFADRVGEGRIVPVDSDSSGMFWFFSPSNWEMLVKVLDACAVNGSYWVFAAPATNVEYTLRVTDTATGVVNEYFNPIGEAAAAVVDTRAIATCSTPDVVAKASPTSGSAPLRVEFSADSSRRIVLYEWDFESDGIVDFSSPNRAGTNHTYTTFGSFTATLRVTHESGETATDSVTIDVSLDGPSIESVSASPLAGPNPLNVTFSADVSGDIVQYAWDFESDGVFDFTSGATPETSHIYPDIGTFTATLRVTDVLNRIVTDTVTVDVFLGGPSIESVSASPMVGPNPLNVTFSAAVRGDIAEYAWDFESDGIFDFTSSTTPAAIHVFPDVGSFIATLRVTDVLGRVATNTVTIEVTLSGPSIQSISADPMAGPNPLSVTFSAEVSGAIAQFAWDFESDGIFDFASPTGPQTTYIYPDVGVFTATLRVTDILGRVVNGTVTIEVSLGGPSIESVSAQPATGLAPLSVTFSAEVTGDIALYTWDFEGDGVIDFSSPTTASTTHVYVLGGLYNATLQVTDTADRSVSASVSIDVSGGGLVARINANPKSGTNPLTVRFTPEAVSAGSSVTGYRWDFDGDGVFDTPFDERPETQVFVYLESGVFNALLEVQDQLGRQDSAVQAIVVERPPPMADVELLPSNGGVPLTVIFQVTATSLNGAITAIVIDPGDGSPLLQLTESGSVSHTYQSVGEFSVRVTVTDAAGESVTIDDLELDVRATPPGSPTAVASVSPSVGDPPLQVSLAPSGSFDPDGSLVLYEWDFDFDGTFAADESTTLAQTVGHTYAESGTHFAALRVTDNAGLTGLDVAKVSVGVDFELRVVDDTFNPWAGETVTVETTQTAEAMVSVEIRDRGGNPVRTLFAGSRVAGTYQDAWDGRDTAGIIVLDRDYYAVLEFELEGETYMEPDEISGGAFQFVSSTENFQNGAVFDPWRDQFWELTFDTEAAGAGASEVTLWVTPFSNTTDITATLRTGDVFGTGRYKAWWAGVTGEGDYIPPRGERDASRDDYLWSAQAFTLPDNTIVVEGGRPQITDPSAEPNLYYPTTQRCLTGQGTQIAFTVSQPSTVEVRVVNMETGNLLRLLRVEDLAASSHVVEWDGKTDSGLWAAPGRYRADITAVADNGNISFLRRVLILVSY